VEARGILNNKSNIFKVCLYVLIIVAIGTGALVLTLPQNAQQKSLSPISSFFSYNLIRQKSLLFEEKDSTENGLREPLEIPSVTTGLLTLPIINSHWETFFDVRKPSYYALFFMLLPLRSPPSFLI